MEEYKTDISNGLSAEEVRQRTAEGKVNGDFNIPSKSVKQIFIDNCFTFFNFINVVLAAFVVAVGSFKNCLFLGVIISNTAIGIFQEIRSKRAVDKLSLISAPKATVLRDGKESVIPVSEVVLDELILLGAGGQICADSRIVSGEIEVNESLITGESDPVTKRAGDELLSGSFVVCGEAKAQAIRIGADNYANKITSGAKYIKKHNSEMLNSINNVIKVISICIIPMILLMFGKEMVIGGAPFADAVVATVSAIIGMIPEGLVLMASMVLAVSVIRLAMHKTLAQDLYCVETLARVDVLCLDKTGTITEGSMEVTDVIPLDSSDPAEALTALMTALNDKNPTYDAIKASYPDISGLKCVGSLPFSSAKKWSLAEFDGKGTYIMGAAEFILKEQLPDSLRQRIEKESEGGYRIILIAHSDGSPDYENKELPANIIPTALVKISDKIRKEAPDTLAFFAEQGVDIRIISGDNPITVSGVAKRAGLADYDRYVDMSTIKDERQLAEAAEKYKIFGRVTPDQKLALVKALKAAGHTVAMTGDGVNDVLALKESDCSIAMQSGSDAARNVSNIVLLDSNFASMPKIVAEGRRSINNIERSGTLFLYKTVYSFLAALMFIFVPMGYPLQAIQLTLINVFTNGIPSFLLALEPNFNIVKGRFIDNVLPRSVLYGLILTLNFIVMMICRAVLNAGGFMGHAEFEQYAGTLAIISIGFAAFVVLFKVCLPLKPWKIGLLAFLVAGFSLGIYVLGDRLLDLSILPTPVMISLFVCVGVTVLATVLISIFEQRLTAFILKIQQKIAGLLNKKPKNAIEGNHVS
ncbi:MAG: HAD-IC family P-type ATPase [Eubacterium sp.]|nr:HAD-IC family P-type ATPase [Eubacterium sp.]